jgi:hypothetical protein
MLTIGGMVGLFIVGFFIVALFLESLSSRAPE